MRYPILIADPPVPFEVWGKRPGGVDSRTAESKYALMTWDDLNALGAQVQAVAADDCALFLWICQPLMVETLRMAEAWGFSYKTKAFCWVKMRGPSTFHVGMGYWTRANTEDVWLLTRGNPQRISRDVSQIVATIEPEAVFAPLSRHSQKPESIQDRIERLCDGPYLELFARRQRPGWTCLGNEIDGRDIRVSLTDLAQRDTTPVVPIKHTNQHAFELV